MEQKNLRRLEREIEKLRRQIARVGDVRPGSVSEQYNVCGKAGCRCKASPPQKHGPYYQLSYALQGKSTTRFVRKEHLVRIRKEVNNYARLRELIDQWIIRATELSDLRTQADSSARVGRKTS
jgi:hypothetical protein